MLTGLYRPLHEAVDADDLPMVRLLLSAGADINLSTYSGKTVHDLARSQSMKEFIKGTFTVPLQFVFVCICVKLLCLNNMQEDFCGGRNRLHIYQYIH